MLVIFLRKVLKFHWELALLNKSILRSKMSTRKCKLNLKKIWIREMAHNLTLYLYQLYAWLLQCRVQFFSLQLKWLNSLKVRLALGRRRWSLSAGRPINWIRLQWFTPWKKESTLLVNWKTKKTLGQCFQNYERELHTI